MNDLFNLIIDGRSIEDDDQKIELLSNIFSCNPLPLKKRLCGKIARVKSYSNELKAESVLSDLLKEGIAAKIAVGTKQQIDMYLAKNHQIEVQLKKCNDKQKSNQKSYETTRKSPDNSDCEDIKNKHLSEGLILNAKPEGLHIDPLEETDNTKGISDKVASMSRNLWASILFVTGIFLLTTFIAFSTNYIPSYGYLGSLPFMELEVSGKWVCEDTLAPFRAKDRHWQATYDAYRGANCYTVMAGLTDGELKYTGVKIPTRYGLVFGFFLISLGITIRTFLKKPNL